MEQKPAGHKFFGYKLIGYAELHRDQSASFQNRPSLISDRSVDR